MAETNISPVPMVGATGKYDGEFVTVTRHADNAVWFKYLRNGQRAFPIYDADWAELSPRLTDFAASAYGPRYASLWS